MMKLIIILILMSTTSFCRAQNLMVQPNYTADRIPMVHEGTEYLYTFHDESAPQLVFLNHTCTVDFKGNSSLFCRNKALPVDGAYNQSIFVEQIKCNAQCAIAQSINTENGVKENISNINPFQKVAAASLEGNFKI